MKSIYSVENKEELIIHDNNPNYPIVSSIFTKTKKLFGIVIFNRKAELLSNYDPSIMNKSNNRGMGFNKNK